MTFLLSSHAIRQTEDAAFSAGLPVASLMEKAALLSFRHFEDLYPAKQFPSVGILAGPGHNGGDAMVIARECLLSGRDVVVWSHFDKHKELTKAHLEWYRKLGGHVAEDLSTLTSCSVLIDGLLGFGTERPAEGLMELAIIWANRSQKPIVAIDLPSGINSDSGLIMGKTIRATHTIVLGTWKEALLQDHSSEYTGELHLVDIGLSKHFIEASVSPEQRMVSVVSPNEVRTVLPPPRFMAGHKYSHGRLLISAGSDLYPGAGILAVLAARALGVGYLVAESSQAVERLLLETAPDVVLRPTFSEDLRSGKERAPNAAILGPGLERDARAIPHLLACHSIPKVIDAGALAFLASEIASINLNEQQILTPHTAEFAKLFPKLCTTKPKSAQTADAARSCGAIILHKGPHTTIAHPDGRVKINLRSTAALARAGTGDVLAGLTGALLAQGVDPFLAAQAAVWLHSEAALIAAKQSTPASVDPMRLIATIPAALLSLVAASSNAC